MATITNPDNDIISIKNKKGKNAIRIDCDANIHINGKIITDEKKLVRYIKFITHSQTKETIKKFLLNDVNLLREILVDSKVRKLKLSKIKNIE